MSRIIYEPTGRAREYAPLACNLWVGCTHACTYCYGPGSARRTREEFACPSRKDNAIGRLMADAEEMAGDPRPVLFSFLTDPYCTDAVASTTRNALEILGMHHMTATILTKAGGRSCDDFDLLKAFDFSYGVSLSFSTDCVREKWEPFAAPVDERIACLRDACLLGIRTWASVEPVVDADEALGVIVRLATLCDEIKLGAWNYDGRAARIDWPTYAIAAVSIAKKMHGCRVFVKKDLAERTGGRFAAGWLD